MKLILMIMAILILIPVSAVSNFQYYREVIITNNGNTIQDYQLKIPVDTAELISSGKLKSDCSDLRVFNSDRITQLPYWVEFCNSFETVIWVNLTIPQGTKTIYLAYGNPDVNSEANGDAVFILFDDFNTAPLNATKWSVKAGSYSIVSGNLYVKMQGGYGTTRIVWTRYLNASELKDYVFEARVGANQYGTSGSYYLNGGLAVGLKDSTGDGWNDKYLLGRCGNANAYCFQYYGTSSIQLSGDNNQYYKYRLHINSSNNTAIGCIGNSCANISRTPPSTNELAIGGQYNAPVEYYVDYLYVRKYVASEPLVNVGPEYTSNENVSRYPANRFIDVRKPYLILFDIPFIKQDRKEVILPTTTKNDRIEYIFSETTSAKDVHAILYEITPTTIKAYYIAPQSRSQYGTVYIENDFNLGIAKVVFLPSEKTPEIFKLRLVEKPLWWERLFWKFGLLLPDLTEGVS